MNHGFERVEAQPGVPALQPLTEFLRSPEYWDVGSIQLWTVRLNVSVRACFQREWLTIAIDPLYANTIVGASGTI